MSTPEQQATEAFSREKEEYAQAQAMALEIIGIREPVRFGEVVQELGNQGLNDHIALHATAGLIRHGVEESSLGMLSLTELGRERAAA